MQLNTKYKFTTYTLQQSVYVPNIKPTKSNAFQQCLSIRTARMVFEALGLKIK